MVYRMEILYVRFAIDVDSFSSVAWKKNLKNQLKPFVVVPFISVLSDAMTNCFEEVRGKS